MWGGLHGKELYALYASVYTIRVMKSRRLKWEGYVARMGESRGANRDLVGKPDGNRSFERPRRRREDNITVDLRDVGCGHGLD
jgi:hypothetical protein